jgi:outer membrane biosynthesis protein TonB
MQRAFALQAREKERRLWLLSFALAMVITLCMLIVIGWLMLRAQLSPRMVKTTPPPDEQVIIVISEPAKPQIQLPTPEPDNRPSFARTSSDQASTPPEKADFIGERDTIATSDAIPIAGAPAMPSQAGRKPRQPGEIETTESRPQDGTLEHSDLASASASPTPTTTSTPTLADSPTNSPRPIKAQPTEQESAEQDPVTDNQPKKMVATDQPILPGDQPVERPLIEQEAPQPQVASNTMPKPAEPMEKAEPELPKPTPKQTPIEPGFRGNQTKTQLSGSISRKGRSALNVANTPMGRYHSALSRAVEAEWHRNCSKYRDFITPGILTVRFVISPDSSVRTISVVEMIDAGEVQKGFTLSSIRQAKIPKIPAELKAEIDDEPIELVYNFYF